MKFEILLQQLTIIKKIKQAPDTDYQIGVLIGSFIPFLILVAFAYLLYYHAKKRGKNP